MTDCWPSYDIFKWTESRSNGFAASDNLYLHSDMATLFGFTLLSFLKQKLIFSAVLSFRLKGLPLALPHVILYLSRFGVILTRAIYCKPTINLN